MKHACVFGYVVDEGVSLCGHPAWIMKPCKRRCKRYASSELSSLNVLMVAMSDGMKDLRAKMTILRARRDRLVEELGGGK